MPTQTFFNLPEEKRRKIIDSSILEFSKYQFPEVSINRIIKSANISRGSFYMYFTDKYDLLMHLLGIQNENMRNSMKRTLEDSIINIDNFILAIHLHFYQMSEDETMRKFYQNVLVYFQGRPIEEIRRIQHQIPMMNRYDNILDIIDKSEFRFSDDKSIIDTIDIALGIFKSVMLQSMIKNLTYEESKEILINHLNILKTGYGKEQ